MMFRRSLLVAGALVAVYAQEQPCLKNPPAFTVTCANEAAALAKAAACANAVISAIWQGKVQLVKSIVVGKGTSLTITGRNAEAAIIDGGGKAQLFDVYGMLTLVNVTVTNGFADEDNGGAVSVRSLATLTTMGSVFSNNVVIDHLKISSSSNAKDFTLEGRGGAVYGDVNSTMTVSNSTFINNTASMRGGGIWSEGTLSIQSSVFDSNAACVGNNAGCLGGGAIACDGVELTISGSTFTNNSAVDKSQSGADGSGLGTGGAISCINPNPAVLMQVSVERSTFTDNTADDSGAGSFSIINTTLTACNFTGNTATGPAGAASFDHDGGTLATHGAVVAIEQCSFINNTAISGDGGALWLNTDPTNPLDWIDSSIFKDNSCLGGSSGAGGAIHIETGGLSVTNTSFTNNTAYTGGAVYIITDNLFVTASNFTANQATVGGAIATGVSTTTSSTIISHTVLANVILTSNEATSGGALNIQNSLDCVDCTISNNSAHTQGGAIVGGPSSVMTLTDTICNNNTCKGNGGCLYTTGMLQCDNCTVTGNEAVFNGAALYTDFGSQLNITFSNSQITDNTAQQSGGAWFEFGSDLQVFNVNGNTEILNNKAGCCYAAGYGSKLQSGASTKCSDTDTGKNLPQYMSLPC
jgi:predicted outer membrane repeat protein